MTVIRQIWSNSCWSVISPTFTSASDELSVSRPPEASVMTQTHIITTISFLWISSVILVLWTLIFSYSRSSFWNLSFCYINSFHSLFAAHDVVRALDLKMFRWLIQPQANSKLNREASQMKSYLIWRLNWNDFNLQVSVYYIISSSVSVWNDMTVMMFSDDADVNICLNKVNKAWSLLAGEWGEIVTSVKHTQ